MRSAVWALLFSLFHSLFPLIAAQSGQTLLGIPSLNGFNIVSTTSPLFYGLPPSAPSITISVALCSSNLPLPRVFVSNSTSPGPTVGPAQVGQNDVFEITFEDGVGFWTGEAPTGASMGVYVGSGALASSAWQFEIAVQEGDTPAHTMDTNLPTLSDTSSTRAIIYSTTFQNITIPSTSYPNYTLPALQPFDSFPVPTILPPSSVLLLQQELNTLPYFRSSCALRAMQSALGFNATQTNLIRSPETGWQTEFFVPGGLTPQNNYTVYVTQGPKISGPIYLQTKSSTFDDTCTFVHALPYCPLVAYPIPLTNSSAGDTPALYNTTNLPIEISSNITGFLANFAMNLGTFACGRDVYSPLHSCTDCMNAYRTWACYVSFPRCAEPSPSIPSSVPLSSQNQYPFALKTIQTSDAPRALGFPNATSPYMEILPCIETCNAVHRNCPPFLQWQCPNPYTNANESYALGVLDSVEGDDEGQGVLGSLSAELGDVRGVVDRFGNIWCNGA
ncbi:stretch-activated cation channel mid1 [Tulasnella sp. 330]|nr:stretch-activated cation channel mid1 [Tulasnella sp. 330]KAG8872337.1 stretch-activated cation channel mid1 [Tulasnella sp. 331]KAG8874622.1 stretch-activated cation channel mid1 [Tulasnella sp. 332]